ncbi:uncharacterized protein RJT21DRAFT_121479 [Scheffersomyces amazonensis]|uniref:uncharacterized protein n=1 Tax=Scheffersomyces amazonensis TaxID=1078765 RepID=UPI00315DF7FD
MQSLDLSFRYDNESDLSLIQLWKITNPQSTCSSQNNHQNCIYSKYSSIERINNRSWRIVSKKLLVNKPTPITTSVTSTTNQPTPNINTNNIQPDTHQYIPLSPLHTITDFSKDSLSDLLPKQSQFISSQKYVSSDNDRNLLNNHINNSARPSSLFSSQNSKLSLASHTRKSTNNSTLESYTTTSISAKQPHSENDQSNVLQVPVQVHPPSSSSVSPLFKDKHNPEHSHEEELYQTRRESHSSTSSKSQHQHQPQPQSHASSHNSSKNMFYIANSPSPPQKNQQDAEHIISLNQQLNPQPQRSSNSFHPQPVKRQSSLFSSTNQIQTKSINELDSHDESGYSSTDIDEDEDEDDIYEEEEEEEDDDNENEQHNAKEINEKTQLQSKPEFGKHDENNHPELPKSSSKIFFDARRANLLHGLKSNNQKSEKIIINTKSKSAGTTDNENDREWLSVSSEDDHTNKSLDGQNHHALAPLQFNKIVPTISHGSNISSTSTDILPIVEENVNLSSTSRFTPQGSIKKPRSLLSGLFLNELANVSHDAYNSYNNDGENSKPVLKRSSTTGIITTTQQQQHNPPQKLKSVIGFTTKRPTLILNKRYTSMTDIRHRSSSLLPDQQVSENLEINQNQIDRNGAGTGSDAHSATSHEEHLWFNSKNKQKSIVGVSYSTVTSAMSAAIPSNYTSDSNDNKPHTSIESKPDHETLSSSLHRISRSVSNNSIRNILLPKQTLNLSRLYTNSKSKFGRSETSFESDKSNFNQLEGSTSKPYHLKPLTPKYPQVQVSPSTPISTSPELSNKVLKDPEDGITSSPNVKAEPIEMSPSTKRKEMLSSELSESLKESIIIDYKLGKIPLPTRVIDSDKIMRANGMATVGGDDSDFDDYHAKGW